MGEIYILTCETNKKSYVGQALKMTSDGKPNGSYGRWLTHLSDLTRATPSCPYLTNAIKKHGKENFTLKVLTECEESELNSLEEKYIAEFGTLAPNGYNLSSGGGNGRRHSDATRQKMKDAAANRKKIRHETGKYPVPKKKQANYSTQKSQLKYKPENLKILEAIFKEVEIKHLPLYIIFHERRKPEWGDGFTVRVPGKTTKTFTRQTLTMIEKYKLALEYLKSLNLAPGVGKK